MVGTNANETFRPLLGQDTVAGGGGIDTLAIDYRSVPVGAWSSVTIQSNGGSFEGAFYSGSNSVNFSNIEKLNVKLNGSDNYVALNASALATSGRNIDLDAGGGLDILDVDFGGLSGSTSFTVDSRGKVNSNRGNFSNFENFQIRGGDSADTFTTGAGDDVLRGGSGNDTMNAGAGNDVLEGGPGTNILNGGEGDDYFVTTDIDKVDGGAGYDWWIGTFTGSAPLTFNFNGITGVGTLSNGTTLARIERVELTTGSGNDAITLAGGGYFVINGGGGSDSLSIDYSSRTSPVYAQIFSANGAFQGALNSTGAQTIFSNIENLTFKASQANDDIVVDPTPVGLGGSLSVDGGAGIDKLTLNLQAFSNLTISTAPGGQLLGAPGTYMNFETFELYLGDGLNNVTLGSGNDFVSGGRDSNVIDAGEGNDIVHSYGADTVDGGTGNDKWTGFYINSESDLVFNYNGSSGSISNGVTLTSIEFVKFEGGSGDDIVNLSGYASDLWGGSGFDTLNADFSQYIPPPREGPDTTVRSGSSGLSGNIYPTTVFSAFEQLDLKLSSHDNEVVVIYETLVGNTGVVDAGLGNDVASIWFNQVSVTMTVGADGSVTDLYGIDLLNFESFDIDAYYGANVITLGNGNDRMLGRYGQDIFDGGGGDDFILEWGSTNGEVDVDTLKGGAGNDTIEARGGDDILIGGSGTDSIKGGTGADTFVFEAFGDFGPTNARDQILDFSSAQGDKIDLSALDPSAADGDQAFAFIGTASFSGGGAAPQLRYQSTAEGLLVQGDNDGNGVTDFSFLVSGQSSLSSTDFFL